MADTKAKFLNLLRSLFNIDGDLLPELTDEEQCQFLSDPARYFIRADDVQGAAIWREIERRQRPGIDCQALEQTATMLETHAAEIFPDINEQGQKHFGRVMMESAAEEIRLVIGKSNGQSA